MDSVKSIVFLLVQIATLVLAVPAIAESVSSCAVGVMAGEFSNCTSWDVTVESENATASELLIDCDEGFEPRSDMENSKLLSQAALGGGADALGLLAAVFAQSSLTVGVDHGLLMRKLVLLGSCTFPLILQVEDLSAYVRSWSDANVTESSNITAAGLLASATSAATDIRCVPLPSSPEWQTAAVTGMKVRPVRTSLLCPLHPFSARVCAGRIVQHCHHGNCHALDVFCRGDRRQKTESEARTHGQPDD